MHELKTSQFHLIYEVFTVPGIPFILEDYHIFEKGNCTAIAVFYRHVDSQSCYICSFTDLDIERINSEIVLDILNMY